MISVMFIFKLCVIRGVFFLVGGGILGLVLVNCLFEFLDVIVLLLEVGGLDFDLDI